MIWQVCMSIKRGLFAPIFGALGVVLAIGVMLIWSTFWKHNASIDWECDVFVFKHNGPICCFFYDVKSHTPKLIILSCDDLNENTFDSLLSYNRNRIRIGGFVGPGGDAKANDVIVFAYEVLASGEVLLKFLGGDSVITLLEHGTRLRLADGRKFNLDSDTQVRLYIKPDGTIVEIDDMPRKLIDHYTNFR